MSRFYKAVCLKKLGKPEEAKIYDELAEKNGRRGFTINEDNAIYERYPYQMRWNKTQPSTVYNK